MDEASAKIVISSGWRDFNNEEKLKALFQILDLDSYIIDVLPKGNKETVISDYLKNNSELTDGYVVLDDLNMSSSFGTHMIKTYDRLTEEDKIKIIDALSI